MVVERRARLDAILVVEHVMNVEHDLLCLGPAGYALQIVSRVADSDRELLRADRAKRRGPASLGDHDLLAGILPLDIIVGALERIEALIRLDPDRLLVAVRLRPVPDRIDVDADEIDEGEELLRARVGCKRNIEMTPLCKVDVTLPGVRGALGVRGAGGVDEQEGIWPA